MFKTVIRLDQGHGLQIERLNFLTDGVYAIVLTLLVLELKIPEGLAPDHLLPALIETAPKFAAFVIAFAAAAVGWSFSYLTHGLMVRSNFSHMIFTFGNLMTASLIPFVSAIMGSYPDAPWGYIPYCIDIALMCLMLVLDLLVNRRALIDPSIDPKVVKVLILSATGVCGVAIAGYFLAYWSPRFVFWTIVVVSGLIWVDYFYLSAWIGRERAKAEAAHETASEVEG